MFDSNSRLEVSGTPIFEGQYVTLTGNREIHGRIIKVDSGTTMTVRWYSSFEWFFVKRWVLLVVWFMHLWEKSVEFIDRIRRGIMSR